MNNVLFIGDLHGSLEVVQRVEKATSFSRVVFIGDYLDSFNRSPRDQVDTLKLVLSLIESDPNKYIGLLGNHELSYLVKGNMCSGYNPVVKALLVEEELEDKSLRLLRPYYWVNDTTLASHAGVSQRLLDNLEMTLEEYLTGGDYGQVGYARGGYSPSGGLYWCHWSESEKSEFVPIEGINQIVGHTHYVCDKAMRFKWGGYDPSINYNIDCIYSDDRRDDYSKSRFLVMTEEDNILSFSQISFQDII